MMTRSEYRPISFWLAWVDRATRAWEPEPLRWLAVGSITRLGDWF